MKNMVHSLMAALFTNLSSRCRDKSNQCERLSCFSIPGSKKPFYSYRTLACENIRFSSLFAAGDVSRGGTSSIQRQKFHTDDVKYVQNLVRSPDWSTEQLHCFSYCLRMTGKRQKTTKVKCKREESLTKQSIFVEYSLL